MFGETEKERCQDCPRHCELSEAGCSRGEALAERSKAAESGHGLQRGFSREGEKKVWHERPGPRSKRPRREERSHTVRRDFLRDRGQEGSTEKTSGSR